MLDKVSKMLYRVPLAFVPVKLDSVALTLHNIPAEHEGWLADTLRRIHKRYGFMHPDELDRSRTATVARTPVLLTFDDGFATNRRVAETILGPLGIKAHFFVATGFVGLSPSDARQFAQRQFYPTRALVESDGATDAMSWEDVRWLAAQGHRISGHTRTHPVLSRLSQEHQQQEIVQAADELEQRIGTAVRSFAYPFGSLASIDESAVEVARERFDHAFANVRGALSESPVAHFLYRQNLVHGSPLWMVEAIIEGRLDWRYRKMRRTAQERFAPRPAHP